MSDAVWIDVEQLPEFVTWGTDEFFTNAWRRFAILHDKGSMLWCLFVASYRGKAKASRSSRGRFYDTTDGERFAHETGNAIDDAKASAAEEMARIIVSHERSKSFTRCGCSSCALRYGRPMPAKRFAECDPSCVADDGGCSFCNKRIKEQ